MTLFRWVLVARSVVDEQKVRPPRDPEREKAFRSVPLKDITAGRERQDGSKSLRGSARSRSDV